MSMSERKNMTERTMRQFRIGSYIQTLERRQKQLRILF